MKTPKLLEKISETSPQSPRMHLGGSVIGNACVRASWYHFRWATLPQFDARLLRLFDRGNREEEVFEKLLKDAGCEVYTTDAVTGEQFRIIDHEGHFGGSLDGIVKGVPDMPDTWMLLEMKTHNLNSFKSLVKDGVLKSKPVHYAQMQIYMGYKELKAALYCAVNKNDDYLYFEIVLFDPLAYEKEKNKIPVALYSETPPPKISTNPSYFECKWCDYYKVCQLGAEPDITCRSCKNIQMLEDGKWKCALLDKSLDKEAQMKACEKYEKDKSFND